MKQDTVYTIGFSGLADGSYSFQFPIRDSFFSRLEYSEIRQGSLEAEVLLERSTHRLLLDFHIHGTVNVQCDHCAEFFDLKLEGHQHLVVKLGSTFLEESEDEITIPESAGELDLHQYLYEFISLMIPYRRIHPGPDQDTPGCSNAELDMLLPPESSDESGDPRWDKLNKLKF